MLDTPRAVDRPHISERRRFGRIDLDAPLPGSFGAVPVRILEISVRGIPPLAAHMYQPGKGELYRRCEYIDGVWRKTETIRPEQPPHGFTISIEVEPLHIEMLCSTWERTTPAGRRLTQLLAELSISTKEGVPTRRYVP